MFKVPGGSDGGERTEGFHPMDLKTKAALGELFALRIDFEHHAAAALAAIRAGDRRASAARIEALKLREENVRAFREAWPGVIDDLFDLGHPDAARDAGEDSIWGKIYRSAMVGLNLRLAAVREIA